MSNPSKAKGSAFEREIAASIGAKRMPLSGAVGGGDIRPEPDSIWAAWSFECKRRAKLPVLITDALAQAQADIAIGDPRSALMLMREDGGRTIACADWDDLRLWSEALAEVVSSYCASGAHSFCEDPGCGCACHQEDL